MASNSTSLSDFAHNIFSYDNNIVLAALISLLLVILFVVLLHAYANCFFPHPRPAPPRLSRSNTVPLDSVSTESKGLDPSTIAAIPLFVYESEEKKYARRAMECAICLSEFEEREIGRRLAQCRHGFHVECIDMWLNSHANCPVCRGPVVVEEGSNCEIHEGQNAQFGSSSSSSSSSSSCDPALMTLGESLKRMVSRNRLDGRIFPSSNGHELNV